MKSKTVPALVASVLVLVSLAPSLRAQNAASVLTNTPLPPGVTLSQSTSDVLRMVGSGVGDDVVLTYIKGADARFNLSAGAVVYLREAGISPAVINGMLNHDSLMPNNPPPVVSQPANPPPANSQAAPQYIYEQKLYAPTTPVVSTMPQTVTPVPAVQTSPAPAAPAAPAPAYVSDAPLEVGYFYQDLSPYGSWLYLEGYGWCWQPTLVVANRQWRPYCDGGHWVDSDAGWYWQSDYTWGWAPFHYGRWHYQEHVGWVWFPDTVWGPGWVVWRTTGDCCGWAPLPLHAEFDMHDGFRYNGARVSAEFDFGLGAGMFTFIAISDFGERDYPHHCLPPVEVTRIYNHTTIINNYVLNEHHLVVNRGIPKERVEEATHRPVRTVAIQNEPEQKGVVRIAPAGVVYKHELRAPAGPVHMVAQKLDANHPVVQHGPVVMSGGNSQLRAQNNFTPATPQSSPTPKQKTTTTEHLAPSAPQNTRSHLSGTTNKPVQPQHPANLNGNSQEHKQP